MAVYVLDRCTHAFHESFKTPKCTTLYPLDQNGVLDENNELSLFQTFKKIKRQQMQLNF